MYFVSDSGFSLNDWYFILVTASVFPVYGLQKTGSCILSHNQQDMVVSLLQLWKLWWYIHTWKNSIKTFELFFGRFKVKIGWKRRTLIFMGRLARVIFVKSIIHSRSLNIQLKLDYYCDDKEGGCIFSLVSHPPLINLTYFIHYSNPGPPRGTRKSIWR